MNIPQEIFERLQARDEDEWISEMRNFLDEQKNPLIEAIERETPQGLLANVDAYVTSGSLAKIYSELYTNQGIIYYEKQIEELQKQLDRDDPYYYRMDQIIQEVTGINVVSVTQTSRDAARRAIREVIERAAMEGWDIPRTKQEIEKAVRDEWKNMQTFRPVAIARTEVGMISNTASYIGALQSGIEFEKGWYHNASKEERPAHAALHRTYINKDEYFNVNGNLMLYPQQPGSPVEEVVNCRCRLVYRPKI